jgi:hypothetical protein
VHEEIVGMSEAAFTELAAQLRQLANWLGLEKVQLNCQRPESQRLRAAGLGA